MGSHERIEPIKIINQNIMLCKNCGWENEPNALRCVKCNAPLQGSMVDNGKHAVEPGSAALLKDTLREPSVAEVMQGCENNADKMTKCPNPYCGYPVSAGMKVCPVCHTPICRPDSPNDDSGKTSTPKAGTINPWAKLSKDSFCTLQRISWEDETANYAPVSYPGQMITLTRANTDANNNTITSKIQAVLTLENGEWFIENKSELQTTLLRVDRKMKLEDGDVIVLGNRMFKFKKG